jgi:hypothetical protein
MSMAGQLLASRNWETIKRLLASHEPLPRLWISDRPFVHALYPTPHFQNEADAALVERVYASTTTWDDMLEAELDPKIDLAREDSLDAFWQPIGGLAACYREFSARLDRIPEVREAALEIGYTRWIEQPKANFWRRHPPPLKVVDEQIWEEDLPGLQNELRELADVLDRLEADGETHVRIVIG